jgi:hypothetical protein
MIDPLVHRLADFSAEATATDRGLFGQKLAIDPGGTRRRDLRVDPEVRPRRKRQPLAAAGVVVGPRLNNGPGLGVACQLANSIRSNGSDEIASELSDRTRARGRRDRPPRRDDGPSDRSRRRENARRCGRSARRAESRRDLPARTAGRRPSRRPRPHLVGPEYRGLACVVGPSRPLHAGRDPADDQYSGHPAGLYLPYFAQCDPKIASGVMVRIASGRETQVRLTKCRALTFSVVMLPPQVPQASESV